MPRGWQVSAASVIVYGRLFGRVRTDEMLFGWLLGSGSGWAPCLPHVSHPAGTQPVEVGICTDPHPATHALRRWIFMEPLQVVLLTALPFLVDEETALGRLVARARNCYNDYFA